MNHIPEEPELPDLDLTTQQEASVRRLLAEARVTEPMPDEVRLRLEDLLRDLAEPSSQRSPSPASVADLAARRRRRVRTLFVAAAAVTAFGVAVPQLLEFTGSRMSGTTSADSAQVESPAPAATPEDTLSNGGDSAGEPTNPPPYDEGTDQVAEPPTLRTDRFTEDAQALRDRIYVTTNSELAAFGLSPDCLAATDRSAALRRSAIAVRYAGQEAALLLGKPVDGTQRAILYVCGESEPRRTTVLAVR